MSNSEIFDRRVILLANLDSPHTRKWANGLKEAGLKVQVLGLSNDGAHPAGYEPKVIVTPAGPPLSGLLARSPLVGELAFLSCLPLLRREILRFRPHFIHAHYIPSYGMIAALSGFPRIVISAWGTDVFGFPRASPFHRALTRFVLRRAMAITSTSHAMAEEMRRYTNKNVSVIPFGVDTEIFHPMSHEKSRLRKPLVVGTVKALERVYGVDILLKAFALVFRRFPEIKMRLLIVGGGSLREQYLALARRLGIESVTQFTGSVDHSLVPTYLQQMDIFVAVSREESFGVAVLEAAASGVPAVVSNVGGLPEIIEHGENGLIVPQENPRATAEALSTLIVNQNLRMQMGIQGRERALVEYQWKANVRQMIGLYRKVFSG